MTISSRFSRGTGCLKALAAPFARLRNSRKTECGAKRFFLALAVRAAPFALLAAACAQAQAPAAFPLLKSCGEGSETVTTVAGSDPVRIRYSFATDTGTCYAVTATVDGKPVDGYFTGGARPGDGALHPAIVAFEQEIRTHPPLIPPPPPQAPAPPAVLKPAVAADSKPDSKKDPGDTPLPLSFAGFRAVDIKGNRVDLSSKRTPNIVVYFWSALDQRGIKKAETMEHIYIEFHTRGVDVVGVASARNATTLRQICTDNEFVWSEILDSGSIANRYHVDPAKPYLLLDQSRNVIAAVASPLELEPILGQLTQRRRVTP
jgi:peroxiredoxin